MISIIIPIYNVEKYLRRCIDSIIAQTYNDLEIILVNDGSTDACAAICDLYATIDNRIKVIHQNNSGVSAARNAGLRVSNGEYVGFVDPDDWCDKTMYENLISAIEEYDADLAICGYTFYDEKYCISKRSIYNEKVYELIFQKEILKRLSDMPPTIRLSVCNKLFRGEDLRFLQFCEKIKLSEDALFLLEYILKIENAVIVHKSLYNNFIRTGSATHGGLGIESFRNSLLVHSRVFKETIRCYPDLRYHSEKYFMDTCMLKYRISQQLIASSSRKGDLSEKRMLKEMRRFIKRYSARAIMNPYIYWKTKILYLIFF